MVVALLSIVSVRAGIEDVSGVLRWFEPSPISRGIDSPSPPVADDNGVSGSSIVIVIVVVVRRLNGPVDMDSAPLPHGGRALRLRWD